jgi:hypothetical protein
VPQWTAPIPEATSALLAKQVKIPAEAIPDNVQVETFVDNDFPRPAADDIYFTKRKPLAAKTQRKTIPIIAIAPLFAVGLLSCERRRRTTNQAS